MLKLAVFLSLLSATYSQGSDDSDVCSEQTCILGNGENCDRALEDCPPCMRYKNRRPRCEVTFFGICTGLDEEYCFDWTPTRRPSPSRTSTPTMTPTTTTSTQTTSKPTTAPISTKSINNTASPSSKPSTTISQLLTPAPSLTLGEEPAKSKTTTWLMYGGIGAGVVLVIAFVVLYIRHRRQQDSDDESSNEGSPRHPYVVHAPVKPVPIVPDHSSTPNQSLNRILDNTTQNELMDADEFTTQRPRRLSDTTSSVEF
ncbi:hypothetical protein AC1031_007875 [Aphanomyces cochlioides]|nr:hypothetical protein AC1031_007875 [Aphanomyces cochlioides]